MKGNLLDDIKLLKKKREGDVKKNSQGWRWSLFSWCPACFPGVTQTSFMGSFKSSFFSHLISFSSLFPSLFLVSFPSSGLFPFLDCSSRLFLDLEWQTNEWHTHVFPDTGCTAFTWLCFSWLFLFLWSLYFTRINECVFCWSVYFVWCYPSVLIIRSNHIQHYI